MTPFRGFVLKEFKQIYRDKRTLVVLFGMPVLMMVLFGFAIRNEVDHVQIAILDFSKDDVTRALIQQLHASDVIEIASDLNRYEEVEPLFRQGKIKMVVVFEADFAKKWIRDGTADVQMVTDAADPNLANLLQSYVSAMIQDHTRSVRARSVQLLSVQQLAEPLANAQPLPLEPAETEFPDPEFFEPHPQNAEVVPSVRMLYNPELRSVNLFVPGLIAVILMLVSALMTSISITREKEMGNMEILLVSPLKPVHILIGKVLPYLVLSVVNIITILLLARLVFDVPFRGSYILFFIESVLFTLTALSLGVFISSVANNQQTAMMAALAGLLMPTVLLSGFIFPVSSMPDLLQAFSHTIPAKWFLIIVRDIMLKGSGFLYLWKENLILLVFTLFFTGVSLKKFNVRLQ